MNKITEKPQFAVYVGRFNPIHLGHMRVVGEMLQKHGKENCLLVIGSSNAGFSLRHFFSYNERRNFIKKVFPDLRMIGLPDYNQDEEWLSALDDLLGAAGIDPKTVTFFGGCHEDIRFFVDGGRSCSIVHRFDDNATKISATEVRDALILGKPLDGMMPEEIIPDIQELFKTKWEKFKKI